MAPQNPPGPKINFALALISLVFPERFAVDPLVFAIQNRGFGDVAYYRAGPLRVYQINSVELIRRILVEQPEQFLKAKFIKRAFGPVAGEGLFTSDGDLWKRQRKLMQPAFNHNQLGQYGQVMVAHAARLANSFRDGEVLEINSEMVALTLGVVVRSLFGADISGQARDLGPLMMALLEAANRRLTSAVQLPAWVPTPRNRREKRALVQLEAVLHSLIAGRRASSAPPRDLLSVLLAATDEESGAGMSDRQLRDEMMTLFLAGHETTANALTWTWYLLSQHPEVEGKLAAELESVLEGRAPTAADLPRLPYLEMVVRESLRLYPPATGFAREPVEDIELGGYRIPRGSLIIVNTWALHRDPKLFTDPERFDPERFGPGWEERIPRYGYLPFGGGPRVCIGNGFAMMEARLLIATLAQRWRFALEPGQEVLPVQLVTLRPKSGIRMRLHRRTAVAPSASAAAESSARSH